MVSVVIAKFQVNSQNIVHYNTLRLHCNVLMSCYAYDTFHYWPVVRLYWGIKCVTVTNYLLRILYVGRYAVTPLRILYQTEISWVRSICTLVKLTPAASIIMSFMMTVRAGFMWCTADFQRTFMAGEWFIQTVKIPPLSHKSIVTIVSSKLHYRSSLPQWFPSETYLAQYMQQTIKRVVPNNYCRLFTTPTFSNPSQRRALNGCV